MQDGSGDTQFTFNDNAAAPAEEISQSSPGDTADSGVKSTRTTKSGWQMTGQRRRVATQSTPRSSRDGARSDIGRRGLRSPRRGTTPRSRPTRAIADQIGERTGEVRAKRRSTDTSEGREPVAIIEELRAQCQSLREQVYNMEVYASSRDQLIKGIEVKFTEYLREHNQSVFNEINLLNHRLSHSTDEIAEYQAELMVASQEDEGATTRILKLERRGILMEHGAQRIHQRGMEIQEEYKDEVHHLQGLLGNTEAGLQQMQQTNVLTTDVANRLFHEGQEMQVDFENSIMEYRNRSEMASFSSNQLEMVSQQQSSIAVSELAERNKLLSEALVHSRKQAELYEGSLEEITRDSRKKVFEANQAKLESDLRHKNTEQDTMKRFALYRNTEAEAIANLRLESQASSNAIAKVEHYEELYVNEQRMNCELKDEIKSQEIRLRKSLTQGPPTIGRGSNQAIIEELQNQVKIAQIKNQDLDYEVHECLQENVTLKEELAEVSKHGPTAHFGADVTMLRSELDSERKMKLASGVQHYERSCEYMGELKDRDDNISLKNSEILDMKRNIDELRKNLKESETRIMSQTNTDSLPYSAGIPNIDLSSRLVIGRLENEVNEMNSENGILRS